MSNTDSSNSDSKSSSDRRKYLREYYENNKDTLKQKAKEKVTCSECGRSYTKSNTYKHMNSIKHKEFKALYAQLNAVKAAIKI